MSTENIIMIATSIVTIASIIANITPNETDNKIVAFIKKVVDLFAINWKK